MKSNKNEPSIVKGKAPADVIYTSKVNIVIGYKDSPINKRPILSDEGYEFDFYNEDLELFRLNEAAAINRVISRAKLSAWDLSRLYDVSSLVSFIKCDFLYLYYRDKNKDK